MVQSIASYEIQRLLNVIIVSKIVLNWGNIVDVHVPRLQRPWRFVRLAGGGLEDSAPFSSHCTSRDNRSDISPNISYEKLLGKRLFVVDGKYSQNRSRDSYTKRTAQRRKGTLKRGYDPESGWPNAPIISEKFRKALLREVIPRILVNGSVEVRKGSKYLNNVWAKAEGVFTN